MIPGKFPFRSSPIEALPKLANLSPTWHGLTQHFSSLISQGELDCNMIVNFTQVAKGVFCKLLEMFDHINVLVDFVPRSLVGEIIQVLLQHVISTPESKADYAVCCSIVANVLFFQPIETMTQSLLQQIVALATMPWMSGEVKLLDLRIGDTLTHNLIGASSKLRSDMDHDSFLRSVALLSFPPKEVSPKWRIRAIKKAFSEGNVLLRRMILDHMPVWMHNIGFSCHPMAKEILSEVLPPTKRISSSPWPSRAAPFYASSPG